MSTDEWVYVLCLFVLAPCAVVLLLVASIMLVLGRGAL